ncbi:hypothetical protein [Moheibacter stercoris]|uniref:DUF4397 domain-containing protein n=1 Tax=Moheibacter stercoris TaxID=1628251 RepID=A0ABV2LQU3_9FLAO
MNFKLRSACCCFLISTLVFAQVGIAKGDGSDFAVHSEASLHLFGKKVDGDGSLGLLLPNVNSKLDLPLADGGSNTPEIDPTMEGMILYSKDTNTVNVYNGEYWEDDKATYVDPQLKQSRFISAGDGSEQQSIVCVILGCGRDEYLQFSHAIDGENSYNNLNITRETIVIDRPINDDVFQNSKFVISEAGTYQIRVNIPTYIAGVVSLTEGASYQIYAFKKDEIGNHKEILLSSVVPNFPGVLGIGGGSNVGVGIATTIALNPGDYVYTMIHSPTATVTVGSELLAWDNSIFNPREILFTKID